METPNAHKNKLGTHQISHISRAIRDTNNYLSRNVPLVAFIFINHSNTWISTHKKVFDLFTQICI